MKTQRVLLQVPVGLKRKVLELADKMDGEVIISGEACYGACDVRVSDAKQLKVDKIVHFGHTKFMDLDFPIDFVEVKEDYDPEAVLEKDFEKIKDFKTIGLVSSLQFTNSIDKAKGFLENKGFKVEVDEGRDGWRVMHAGQILGCDVIAGRTIEKKVDAFLFIGTGKFHPLGLAMETEKPVFVLDAERNEILNMDKFKKQFLKQKYTAIGLAKHAKTFGILISTKPGQSNIEYAISLKKRLEKNGKKAYLIAFDEIRAEKLDGLNLDAYVNTACPRIGTDDRLLYKKPILNPDEVNEILQTES